MRSIFMAVFLIISGCSIHHTHGERPELEFEEFEEFCTERFRIGTSQGGPKISCRIRLKTNFLW